MFSIHGSFKYMFVMLSLVGSHAQLNAAPGSALFTNLLERGGEVQLRNSCSANCDLRFCERFGETCVPKGFLARGQGPSEKSLLIQAALHPSNEPVEAVEPEEGAVTAPQVESAMNLQCKSTIEGSGGSQFLAERAADGTGRIRAVLVGKNGKGETLQNEQVLEVNVTDLVVDIKLDYQKVLEDSKKICREKLKMGADEKEDDNMPLCEMEERSRLLAETAQSPDEIAIFIAMEFARIGEVVTADQLAKTKKVNLSLYTPKQKVTGGVSAIAAATQGIYELIDADGVSMVKVFFTMPVVFKCE